jgi:biopolymer transport protein ExbD
MRMHRHSSSNGSDEHATTGIDLAPMLDFVLNLLIFFIIIAVFVKESGLIVNRPTGEPPPKSAEQSIAIQILANGEVWVDGRVVDPQAVRANVERMHASSPKSGVLIIADPKAPTGLLVQVIDEVHLGEVYNVSFATTE